MSTNGNNPRLDRIERLIEQSERANKEAHAKTREDLRRTREDIRRTREAIRRWAALGVQEARRQRKKIAVLEAKSAQYQARTDQNLAEITDKLNGLIGYVAGE